MKQYSITVIESNKKKKKKQELQCHQKIIKVKKKILIFYIN